MFWRSIRIGGVRRAVVVVAALAIALPAIGQRAAVVELREEEFLEGLDADHPAVVTLAGELARAEAELRRAGAFDNPTIEFEKEAPQEAADQSTWKLAWRPPLDGRRGLAVEVGESSVEAARSRLEWAQLQLRQELRAAFAEWAVAARRRALVSRHLETLRELEARLQLRAARGEESQLAARRFALAVVEVQAELARGEAELARVRASAFVLREGLPEGAEAILPELPAPPVALDGVERPDLLALRSEVDAAALRRRLAGRVLRFPTLVAGWTRIEGVNEDQEGPYFGAAWELPLFDRNQADRRETAHGVAIAEARLRLGERDVEQRRTAAVSAYAALHESHVEIDAVVSNAAGLSDAASASFLAGESSMTDLLETLRSVLESQLAALELRSRALAAHRELELAAGRALMRGEEP